MPLTIEQFGKSLTASGLVSTEELQALWSKLAPEARPNDGDALARLLVKHGKLTEFQARQIAAGRGGGLVFGEYVLVELIGEGGMGKVFKARHRRMARTVALKVMSAAAMKDEAAVKRFQREVRAAAKLEHPQIVTAYDAGQAGATHFLVMQFVDGGDLAELVKTNGPLPVESAVDYVVQAARGLAFAHGEGVVHRDIKPANLLLDKKGVVKILDMGLARIEGADGLTATEQVMGTVDYMSPEQASDTKNADARSDIYSLGCTLWFLLTGKKLYDGDSMISRLMKHRDAPLPSLVKERDDASWGLEQALHKMLAKRADERFATMDEVIAALEPHGPASSSGGGSGIGMGSSIGMGGPRDADLSAFFKGIAPQSGSGSKLSTSTKTDSKPDVTAALSAAKSDTDSSLRPRSKVAAKPQPAKPPLMLIAGGVLGSVALIGLVAFILTRGNDAPSVDVETVTVVASGRPHPGPLPAGEGAKPPPPAVAPFDALQARKHQEAWAAYLGVPVEKTNRLGMKFVLVPPGTFLMGASQEQIDASIQSQGASASPSSIAGVKARGPQHRVTISKPLYVGATEVTVGQYSQFTRAARYTTHAERDGSGGAKLVDGKSIRDPALNWKNPGWPQTDEHPVAQVTWNDAAAFCSWLSREELLTPVYYPSTGRWQTANRTGYCLPTEAEWEYVCRAGTTTRFYWGDTTTDAVAHAWTSGNTQGAPQPVGRKLPNPFGLFDIQGNLREWTQDIYGESYYAASPAVDPEGPHDGEYQAVRGGPYYTAHDQCQSVIRYPSFHASAYYFIGFRVVLPLTLTDVQQSAIESLIPTSATSATGAAAPPPTTPYDFLTSPDYEWSEPVNLGEPVNTAAYEGNPCLSADGLTLLFDSDRPGGLGARDLWQCRRASLDAPWSTPENLGPPVNTPRSEGAPSLSADGLTLYFNSEGLDPGYGAHDLAIAVRKSPTDSWSVPRALGATINDATNTEHPEISHDGLSLAFTSYSPGGFGKSDLWQSTRRDLTSSFAYSSPLKPPVNSDSEDRAPTLSSDGRVVIYFRIGVPGGVGGTDLWMSTRAATSAPWSLPQPLPKPVNLTSNEEGPHLSPDGKTLIFASNRGGNTNLWITHRVPKNSPSAAMPASSGVSSDGSTESNASDVVRRLDSPDYQWSPPENLGPNVNGPQIDRSPTLTSDELSLFFYSNRHGPTQDFFECRRANINEPFGPAERITAVPPTLDKAGACISADGLTLYFYADSGPNHAGDRDVYLVRRTARDAPWGAIENAGRGVNGPSQDSGPCISPDGLSLAFTSNRPGGMGGLDVYVSRRTSTAEPFGPAVNLGANINGTEDDRHPRYLSDNRTIIFDRNFSLYRTSVSAAGTEHALSLSQPAPKTGYAWVSRDGGRMYFVAGSNALPGGQGNDDVWVSHRLPKKN